MIKQLRNFCTLLLLAVASMAWADEETITFSEKGYANATEVTSVEGKNVTLTFAKGSNSNAPKYYTSGTAVRAYGGNTMTVSSDYTITGITITFGSSDGSNTITADGGTYSNGTWTGSATSVVFTIGGTSGNRRISAVKVTYTASSNVSAAPTISGTTSFLTSTDVTITAADGATIYYTTDGNDPTTGSTQYTGAITLTETTTVKAIAVESGKEASSVASKTFTKLEVLENIAALIAAGKASAVQLTDAVVTYVNNRNAYMEDASAGIYLYGCAGDLVAGDKINGVINVTGYTLYNKLPEVTAFTLTDGSEKTSGNEVTPTVVTIAELNADYTSYISRYVKIEDATVTSAFTSKNSTIEQNGESIVLRDQNSTATLETTTGDVVTVTAHPSIYNTTKQIAVYEQSQIVVKEDDREAPGFSFNPATLTITEGEEYDAPEFVNPNNVEGIVFSSTDEDVASWDATNGFVLGEKTGKATITATFEGNDDYKAGTATLVVTVKAAPTEHTFDFVNNDYGLTHIVAQSDNKDNYNSEESITGKDGVVLAVTGTNAFRYWETTAGVCDFRFYKTTATATKTMTITAPAGKAITKIVFAGAKVGTGTSGYLSDTDYNSTDKTSTWTGDAAQSVEFTATNTVQLNTIDVTLEDAEAETVTIPVNANFPGTTFSTDKALDFTTVEGLTAYIVTDAQGTTEQVTKVPANTGLYLEVAETAAEKREFEVPVTTEEVEEVKGNLLIPTDGSSVQSDNTTTYYAYGKQNGKFAFFKVSATKAYTPSANKALLAVPTAESSAKDMIDVNGGATAIDNLQFAIDNAADAVYNLSGQRVAKAQKGVYIVNGKKIVIR